MSDLGTLRKNLLQDLMQRARGSTHGSASGGKAPGGRLHSSVRGLRSSNKSPKVKSQRRGSLLQLPSLFKTQREQLSLETSSKTGSLKENAKRGGSKYRRSKSPGREEDVKSKSPLARGKESSDSSDKKDHSLKQRVLQLVTPSKRKSRNFDDEEQLQQHVLYTTYEHDKLKHAVLNNETIPVVPWKTTKNIPVSPGRSQTKVSYCTSCGHVDNSDKVASSEEAKTPSKQTKDKKPDILTTEQKEPAPAKELSITATSTPKSTPKKDKQAPEPQTEAPSISKSFESVKIEISEPVVDAKQVKTTTKLRPLIRSKSLSSYSPEREDTEPQILRSRTKSVKTAIINQSPSLRSKPPLVRRFTEDNFNSRNLETQEQIFLWKEQIKNSIPILPGCRFGNIVTHTTTLEQASPLLPNVRLNQGEVIAHATSSCVSRYNALIMSTSNNKAMMPKVRNSSTSDIYPLLKTKIPEEHIHEDGSVTYRKGGLENDSNTDVDRDSGVDVDNGGKQLFRANSSESDLDNELDTTLTPDSALAASENDDLEFDFNTLKKSKQPVKDEHCDADDEENNTLTRHSSTSSKGESKNNWDMYALLKRFEFIEWELKPAENLKKQTLDLDNCNLDNVPAAVTEIEYYAFRDVEAVSLNHNSKIDNADVLGKLADLRIINMWGCNLRAIPQTWARLTKLQMLGLGNNKELTQFGPLKHLSNLIWLDLGGCGLKKIPDEVTNMMKLKVLALGGNPGIEIGDEICSLWDLKKLGLNDCELEVIPKSVFSLIKLTHLHLDNNFINHINQEIVQLTSLEELTVTGNCGIVFPKLLSQCDTVKCIIVDSDKDLTRMSSVLKQRIKSMPTAMSPVKLPPPENLCKALT